MKKIFVFLIMGFSVLSFSKYLEKYRSDFVEYTFNLQFDKYIDESLNHYVYISSNTVLKEKPDINSKTIKSLKVKDKLSVVGLLENKNQKWYEVRENDKFYYVPYTKAIKREFNWQRAIKNAYEINQFILDTFGENKDIYYVDSYISLSTDVDGKKDKFGNSANQSIKAYYDGGYINLPDRSLFSILKEDDKFVFIKTLAYGDVIYRVSKNDKRKLKKSNIVELVNKYIYVDRHSQTQVTIERDIETNIFNVNAGSYVTTGISKGVGFVTPKGVYLVYGTKPVMQYVSDYEKEVIYNNKGEQIGEKPIVVGEALRAIRFTGGAYIHGVPATFGTKQEVEARKKITASKLGTVPLSHKCVRNADDIQEYLYKWVNGNNKIKNGITQPEQPVIVIVE